MDKQEFEGEYYEKNEPQDTATHSTQPKKGWQTGKSLLVGLLGGVIGAGLLLGGMKYYQNKTEQPVTVPKITMKDQKNGQTKVSDLKVNVDTQATKAFEKIKGAVVSVEAYKTSVKADQRIDDLFSNSNIKPPVSGSSGSGVIYKKVGSVAYVVTNNHVIAGADKYAIILADGKKIPAQVVGKDAVTDLAVLKVESKDIKTIASFGDSNNIKVGETALAIGSPLGSNYATSLTQGIISAKKRTLDVTNSKGVSTGQATVIQTDAAINPGNSGGPLINLAGQVIGINSMKLTSTGAQGTSVEGMGFAIPSNEVVSIINQLVAHGKVQRPALGVMIVNLSYINKEYQTNKLHLPAKVTSGVVITEINPKSPLKKTKIKANDVIVKLDDKKITDVLSLREALYEHQVGDKITISYYHHKQLKTAQVTLSLEG
ncbi:endopeptidase [Ligilactobacillus ceti DSM 22408]|uniref:Endopeptidase n=2 Tax=Ligilactobacillus TaxID=2767887 RepID=A0A0R2KRG5_9LACO|nr:trypsin-like peptidase domain-containing protein [Ligilactobacillus ceti]KRN89130.1 endopeptidase [Ligilactobacillus ceti DSM 22408]